LIDEYHRIAARIGINVPFTPEVRFASAYRSEKAALVAESRVFVPLRFQIIFPPPQEAGFQTEHLYVHPHGLVLIDLAPARCRSVRLKEAPFPGKED
jgi:hypothetical protein